MSTIDLKTEISAVEHLLERWMAAFAASDVDAIVATFASDATFIGTVSDTVIKANAGIRSYFELALVDRVRAASFERQSLQFAGDTVAIASGLNSTGELSGGIWKHAVGRLTIVAQKREGEWKIVHFHRSACP
jgi:uncharacterized protein (TIGR02246 family)